MLEPCRVLRPGWPALLQVPIGRALRETVEDRDAVTEADRIRLFGQPDHVRLHAAGDYLKRLEHAGFGVNLESAVDCLREEPVQRDAPIREAGAVPT